MDEKTRLQAQAILQVLQDMNGNVKCNLADLESVTAMVRRIELARETVLEALSARRDPVCTVPNGTDVFVSQLSLLKETLDTVAFAAATLESHCRTRDKDSLLVMPLAAEQLREAFAGYTSRLAEFSSFLSDA